MSPSETVQARYKVRTSMINSIEKMDDDTPLLLNAEDDSDIMTFGQPFNQSRASASGSERTLENVQFRNK